MHHRYFLLPSFIVTCVLLFAACGDSSDRQPTTQTIRLWHFWSEPGHKAALRELLKDFEAQHHCAVELTELSWNDGKAKLQAAFNSGAPPDVVELGSDWVAQFSGAGVLKALRQIDTSTLIPYSIAPGRHAGALYAAPWVVDTRVIFVNAALLGRHRIDSTITLDQLLSAAEGIHATGTFGWGANGADAHRLYKKILPFLWTFGGDVLDAQGRCVLYSPQNVRALTLYTDLSRAGMIETQRQLDAAFLQGRIAVWNSGSWLIKKIRSTPSINVAAIAFPGIDGQPGISFAGGEYLAVSSASRSPDLSEKLVQYLVSPAVAKSFCSKIPEAGFPAALAAYDDPSLQTDPLKAVFARQLRTARMTPVHPKWLDIEAMLEGAVVRVLLGEASPDQALKEAHSEIADIIGN